MIIYIDGRFVPKEEARLSVFDHGFLYGDGVFEGIRVYNGKVFQMQGHLDRLFDSAKAIDLEVPVSMHEMAGIILEVLRKNKLKNGYVRPIVTRGVGDLGLDPRKCPRASIIVIAVEWGPCTETCTRRGSRPSASRSGGTRPSPFRRTSRA